MKNIELQSTHYTTLIYTRINQKYSEVSVE